MKFERDELKSEYSRKNAKNVFWDLIKNIKSKLIVVSYNNTYDANSSASNNKITEEDLILMLNKRGKTCVKDIKYKSFNSGKTNFADHKEKLYICQVDDVK
jgi:adenine-specific DNA-methyltransferase